MAWDPEAGALSCEYCGGKREIETAGAPIEEYSLADAGERATGLGLDVRAARCENCGAKVAFDEASTAERCVFCGSASVLVEEARRNAIRPESLIPLDVGRDTVQKSVVEWIGGLWFRPGALKKLRRFEAVGVYVPYWTYDCAVHSRWTAEAGHYYYVQVRHTVMRNRIPTTVMRRERRTRWEPAAGQRYDTYDDVRVLASHGVGADLARQLGKYDTSKLVPYRPEYLAGWAAEEYRIDLEQGWELGRKQIEASQERRCSGDVPGDTQRHLQVRNRISDVRWKHLLLPMWSLSFDFRGKTYPVLVHGQTGRVVGKAPYSGSKIFFLILFIALVIVALVAVGSAS
jgi:DNA-directed RNA polymerase subunit RPC12/RpoP